MKTIIPIDRIENYANVPEMAEPEDIQKLAEDYLLVLALYNLDQGLIERLCTEKRHLEVERRILQALINDECPRSRGTVAVYCIGVALGSFVTWLVL